MGSVITINDTLRITKAQGFPTELDYKKHLSQPFSLDEFQNKDFTFTAKSGIRVYQAPPVRNFLVEDREGKWIY